MFDSVNNHTKQLAEAISNGIQKGGSLSQVYKVNTTSSPGYTEVSLFHGLALGSPVYFANPSAATLQWIFQSLGPGWENRTFQDVPSAVFATGGGIHQGTESTIASLSRGLLNFGFRPVTPDVEINGFYGSFGASAVTGTPPYFLDETPIDQHFIDAAILFGEKIAKTVQQEWKVRCSKSG